MTTVMIVDDEPNLIDLVKGYLEREGFNVLVAGDGPSAVETTRSHRPDLIVLDVMLPGFDGVEACRQIRQFSDAYVLMLTARTYNDPTARTSSARSHARSGRWKTCSSPIS